ncbi:MAG TPA: tRNA (N6-threonylcarbamoyladenosine(37)-N6)-methyltransferase TrmO [Bacteroidales bacterium]|nr:tRNA (N6-threonylcarbamoyladenosine(37)-N6)-methyltransferase TrmO [Bacteroidales bacterium]
MDLNINIIGYVRNTFNKLQYHQTDALMRTVSTIEIKEEYVNGLYKIENYRELNILWYFDRSKGYDLRTTTHSGDYRGVFACCSPHRPSSIGLTRVTLLECDGNILRVTGLDALNGTPVLDIKPSLYLDTPSAFIP